MVEIGAKLVNPSQTAARQIRIRVHGVVVVHVRMPPIAIPVQGVTEHVMGISDHRHSHNHDVSSLFPLTTKGSDVPSNALPKLLIACKAFDRKEHFHGSPD